MTYREEGARAAALLSHAGIEQAEAEARQLMDYVCGTDLGFFLLHSGEGMPAEQAKAYRDITEQRCSRIPLQHLTGEQEFMGLTFRVNGDVLIPRQETELLVEAALRTIGELAALRGTDAVFSDDGREAHAGSFITKLFVSENTFKRNTFKRKVSVLDLCTGSGCIAVAVKSFCPDAEVSGSDISEKALRIAEENAARNSVDVTWICADLFQQKQEYNKPARSGPDSCEGHDNVPAGSRNADIGIYDLIVCNPPYIPTDIIDTLMPEVRDHDPHSALDGGADGLSFYRRILDECGAHLYPDGRILFEIGSDQGKAVSELMRGHGFEKVEVSRDLAGLERIVSGEKS